MRKINTLFIVLAVLITVIFSGCSSGTPRGGRGPIGANRQNWAVMPNLTDEQRQQMIEERQRSGIEACQDKNEGDSCTISSPRGETEGKCQAVQDALSCTFERQGMPGDFGGEQ